MNGKLSSNSFLMIYGSSPNTLSPKVSKHWLKRTIKATGSEKKIETVKRKKLIFFSFYQTGKKVFYWIVGGKHCYFPANPKGETTLFWRENHQRGKQIGLRYCKGDERILIQDVICGSMQLQNWIQIVGGKIIL